MKTRGGSTLYGHPIGIIMLDTRFPRVPGDIGNASTWPFPVRYRAVLQASPERVVRQKAEGLLESFLTAAHDLVKDGVRAVTTSCGFLSLYQQEIAAAVPVPVFTSSLMQVPLVARMLRPDQKVGVMTVDSRYLTESHLRAVGAESLPVVIVGLETEKELTRVLVDNELELDAQQAEMEMVHVARQLVSEHPEVGAIVLECTNMPPYARAVQQATGLPVFDIVTLTHWVYHAFVAPAYPIP
ncbi:MAG: aspartate/glutamate racemase family protein [Nitrospiraceae bacterium]